ncbi:MAG: hypothetical protein ACYSWP_20075 [Planctomycetota bacterium]|jgi:hypothetical protein
MKNKNDKFNKALNELGQRSQEKEVPKEVVEGTLASLRDKQAESEAFVYRRNQRYPLFKAAIAAGLVMAIGFAAGVISGPDAEQLTSEIKAKLKPQITEAVILELAPLVKEVAESAVLVGCNEFANEFSGQLRSDIDKMGLQVLAASGALTTQRLEQLIEAINTAQQKERYWITSAFEQIESNRLEDKQQLTGGLRTLAFYTEDEIKRTKQDFAKLVLYKKSDGLINNETDIQKP